MPDTLALEWEHDQITGVLAALTPGSVRLKKCFVIPRAEALTSNESLPADWLKGELSKLGISPGAEVVISLPRDDTFVRRLELPETPDDELPTMVRFQMGAKSSVAMDDQHLDFLPLVKRSELPGREVLAAMVPNQLLETLRHQAVASGSQLVAVGSTPTAVAELIARSEASLPAERHSASLLVGRFGSRLEISVYHLGGLLFSHAARLNQDPSATEPHSIVPEVSRALVALRGAIADVKIEHAWLLVSPAEQAVLSAALQRRLSCEVQGLDPFVWVDKEGASASPPESERSQFAGPIGMLLSRTAPKVAGLDFLNPRQTVVKKDNRKQRLIYAGAGAGLALASLIGLQFFRISSLDSDLEELQNRQYQLAGDIKKGVPTDNALALVEKWRSERIDWLQQLGDVVQRMPSTDRMYLESLQLSKTGNRPAKIVAHGFAREQKDVMELATGLHTSDRYRVMPYQAAKTSTDGYYPWRIEGQEIVLNEPKKPKPGSKPAAGVVATPTPSAAATPSTTPASEKPETEPPAAEKSSSRKSSDTGTEGAVAATSNDSALGLLARPTEIRLPADTPPWESPEESASQDEPRDLNAMWDALEKESSESDEDSEPNEELN